MAEILGPQGEPARAERGGWERIRNPKAPPNSRTYVHRGYQLAAVVSRDMGRWHMSVSHRERVPTWGELGMARDALLPAEVWLMVPHPPREHWINYDRRVLHLWEFRDPELQQQFVFEGAHARRMGSSTPDSGSPL